MRSCTCAKWMAPYWNWSKIQTTSLKVNLCKVSKFWLMFFLWLFWDRLNVELLDGNISYLVNFGYISEHAQALSTRRRCLQEIQRKHMRWRQGHLSQQSKCVNTSEWLWFVQSKQDLGRLPRTLCPFRCWGIARFFQAFALHIFFLYINWMNLREEWISRRFRCGGTELQILS